MVAVPGGSIVAFLVAVLVGGLSLAVAATLLTARDIDVVHGAITGLLGALVWAVLSLVPLIGGLLAVVGYLVVVQVRYPGGWVRAALIAVAAWVVAQGILFVLGLVGIGVGVLGVPGV